MSIEIKFDSLHNADLASFAYASPSDYPDGRYSATITRIEAQTTDKSGKFCFRFRISLAIDRAPGKPRLNVTDLVSFTNGNEYSAIGGNVFADLAAVIGLDRDSAKAAALVLRNALASQDKPAVAAACRNLAEMASGFTGSRVAPNIVWADVDGRMFANVRGSRSTPSYLSASNELDPSASFTGDDVGDTVERQPKPRRNLKAVRR